MVLQPMELCVFSMQYFKILFQTQHVHALTVMHPLLITTSPPHDYNISYTLYIL